MVDQKGKLLAAPMQEQAVLQKQTVVKKGLVVLEQLLEEHRLEETLWESDSMEMELSQEFEQPMWGPETMTLQNTIT